MVSANTPMDSKSPGMIKQAMNTITKATNR